MLEHGPTECGSLPNWVWQTFHKYLIYKSGSKGWSALKPLSLKFPWAYTHMQKHLFSKERLLKQTNRWHIKGLFSAASHCWCCCYFTKQPNPLILHIVFIPLLKVSKKIRAWRNIYSNPGHFMNCEVWKTKRMCLKFHNEVEAKQGLDFKHQGSPFWSLK